MRRWRRFVADDQGPTTVEYAVILALIVAALLGAVQNLTTATRDSFDSSADALF
ncbi:MAG: Flp family type IVb pilin [Planctomycetota bacterium]|nr:MAG: Flp family type IVb pilin [Planctomycetota bacterium]